MMTNMDQVQIAFRAENQQMTLLPRKIQIGFSDNARLIWGQMFCEVNILMFVPMMSRQEQKYNWACSGFLSSDGSFVKAIFTLQKKEMISFTYRIPTVSSASSLLFICHMTAA